MDNYLVKLAKSAQFYQLKNEKTCNDLLIREIIDCATSNRKPDADYIINKFRETISANRTNYKYSLKVYLTERPVYFIEGNQLKDQVYAFILLIELDKYLVVLRKSCSNFKEKLYSDFSDIEYSKLSSVFTANANLQKLSVRNMTVADAALRGKSFEAEDLIGLISTHGAGHSIPYYFKVSDDGHTRTINVSSNRIVEYSQRDSLDQILLWIKDIVKLIDNQASNDFLRSFAQPIRFDDILNSFDPSSILIDSHRLAQLLNDENLEIYYTSKLKKTSKKIPDSVKLTILTLLSSAYKIDHDKIQTEHIPRSKYSKPKINRNKDSLTFCSKALQKFTIKIDGKVKTLQKYIIEKGIYSICFNNPKYIYYMKRCFKNESGISEVDDIINVFIPDKDLSNCKNEKGKIKKNSRVFPKGSIFRFVEDKFSSDDYLLCDDLGDEWADHISLNINDESISFIHSKYGETSLSASNLHVIVGQAIKNLGNMYFDKKEFHRKKEIKLNGMYGNNSKIKRLRKGNKKNLMNDIDALQKNPKLRRKCILICSFISKSEITIAFNKLKGGKNIDGHIVQLLWILSSFLHATKDLNIVPVIYCKE